MKIINFFSNTIILFFILITLLLGIMEKKNLLDLFLEGVKEGERLVIDLFPTLLALIVAVGMMNQSGFIHFISYFLRPIFHVFKIDSNLIPLVIVRPISSSTTTAIVTDLMQKYGADSKIGLISSCILGSTETTIYVASIYSTRIHVKDIKEVVIIGLIVDFIGVLLSCFAYEIGLMKI